MLGIKTAIKFWRARRRFRKQNSNNFTTLGCHIVGLGNIRIGNHTYGEINVLTSSKNPNLKIGSFCSIAKNVMFIISNEHPTNYLSTYPFRVMLMGSTVPEATSKGGISIGDDVWIGFGATILDGVSVGQGAIIGAGSVITKNIPPYAIVGGVPAKIISFRFSTDTINELVKFDYASLNQARIIECLNELYTEIDSAMDARSIVTALSNASN